MVLNSWRSTSAPVSEPAQVQGDSALEIAKRRIPKMDDDFLRDFIDENVGGISRDLSHWRSTGAREHLHQAILATQVQELAIRELLRRG